MNKPEMILFDWGNTLATGGFDGVAGTRAVLNSSHNPNNVTAEEVQAFADKINRECGREYGYNVKELTAEIHNHPFQRYLYEYFGVEFDISQDEVEEIFWSNANPVHNTEGIEEFLRFLKSENIRTGVISNISFTEKALARRINSMLPDNEFEFIIASSEYVFRKPNGRLFELALRKAGITADKAWYCGDNVNCDVIGAYNAGITPVWYTGDMDGKQTPPPFECITVSKWKELKEILLKVHTTV
ncbi:MAG: HAD family hydrolase [Eubacterium sp.]|nr:HAD family hydrolase [Eubacterium sp.]